MSRCLLFIATLAIYAFPAVASAQDCPTCDTAGPSVSSYGAGGATSYGYGYSSPGWRSSAGYPARFRGSDYGTSYYGGGYGYGGCSSWGYSSYSYSPRRSYGYGGYRRGGCW